MTAPDEYPDGWVVPKGRRAAPRAPEPAPAAPAETLAAVVLAYLRSLSEGDLAALLAMVRPTTPPETAKAPA